MRCDTPKKLKIHTTEQAINAKQFNTSMWFILIKLWLGGKWINNIQPNEHKTSFDIHLGMHIPYPYIMKTINAYNMHKSHWLETYNLSYTRIETNPRIYLPISANNDGNGCSGGRNISRDLFVPIYDSAVSESQTATRNTTIKMEKLKSGRKLFNDQMPTISILCR